MGNAVHVFIYLTGPGWNILREHGFLADSCQYQFPVTSQLGCSHAALSTTLTGQEPDKHGHFSGYYFKRSNTLAQTLQRLYTKLRGKPSGYVGKYSIPLRNLNAFLQTNHWEENLSPGGFAPLTSIIDLVHEKKLAYSIVNTARGSPIPALKDLRGKLEKNLVEFAFIQVDELDALLHHSPDNFRKINRKLRHYERQIRQIITTGKAAGGDFNLTILSGHGMTPAPQRINIKKKIDALGMDYGNDYYAVYDPTMARFWFKNNFTRSIILDKLRVLRHCRVLSSREKKDFGIDFPDHRYGETIALVDPGFQISPNDVLARPVAAMHGYDPDHPDSLGACLSTRPVNPSPGHVKDFFTIMADFVSGHE
ncbi:MAG: hypothetical protein PHH77_08325 [Victivallaceae bacterium]|nr:hypothetical protein [Victivallaceae bacterium]